MSFELDPQEDGVVVGNEPDHHRGDQKTTTQGLQYARAALCFMKQLPPHKGFFLASTHRSYGDPS